MPYGEGYVLPDRYYDVRPIDDGVYRIIVWEDGVPIFDDIIDENEDVTI